MVASRISRYVANLTPREYEYERELYYNCEPYADLEDWSVLLNEAIEAQLRGRPPRPLFHPGQEEAFVTAYGHLDDRAQARDLVSVQCRPQTAAPRPHTEPRHQRSGRRALINPNSGSDDDMEGEFWWLAWENHPERTPATASGAHAPTPRPPRLSRNAAPAPPSGVESDPPPPYDFVQQAASEHGEPPPYESRLHLPPSPNQPNSSAAASTPAGSSRASTRRVPSGSDQRDRAPATSNVTSQGPSPPAPVPIAYRFSGTFSRLGLGQRNTGAHTSTYTPTPNPAQQQRAVQTMNALCISGVIGVPEMATAYLDSQSA